MALRALYDTVVEAVQWFSGVGTIEGWFDDEFGAAVQGGRHLFLRRRRR